MEGVAMETPAQDLCRFIDAAPAPRLAAQALVDALEADGFRAVGLTDAGWSLGPGGWYVARGGTVIAWRIRGDGAPKRFALIGAHTDSPNLRLKARAAYAQEGCLQLGVEPYGGVLWNSWLDRDLGLAGAVYTVDGAEHLVRIHKPLARVAQLAIHLDRTVNEGLKLNPQQHLAPLWGLSARSAHADPGEALADLLARAAGVDAASLVGHDLSLYDLTPSTLGGAHDELVFAPRLDNLASCHAGLLALRAAADGPADTSPVLACFDHEEIGSTSADGAAGVLLGTVLERIFSAFGATRDAWHAAMAASLMLSADMAHATHPNYADKHEPRHKPSLGGGPVLKTNVNLRYATQGPTAAHLRRLAREASVPLQDFVTRTDLGCGSTIGPLTAARLGLAVVDLGAPMLSMHSARECTSADDHAAYAALLTAHLRA
jgi:aspartyl aminopeptidase